MGVYIKGMKPPENCGMCFYKKLIKCKLHTDCDRRVIHHDCPIWEVPEPHGRLIDADAMKLSMKCPENNPELAKVLTGWIEKRPTIIERSEPHTDCAWK